MNQPVPHDLRLLVDTAVKQWSEFDNDEPINGAQLVEWFATWRALAKIALEQSEEANASPLANAAPDLLAALQEALKWLEVLPIEYRNSAAGPTYKARAAIAKATGEA
jgi:hypothetical protein